MRRVCDYIQMYVGRNGCECDCAWRYVCMLVCEGHECEGMYGCMRVLDCMRAKRMEVSICVCGS